MKDKKDLSERLNYLKKQKLQQENRKHFYEKQILEAKQLLKDNEHELKYNQGWIEFHEKASDEHIKQIKETPNLDEKIDQEEKLKFHIKQIEEHHSKNIQYHKKEIDALSKEILLFKKGIERCKLQLKFIEEKIKENS